LNSHTQVPALTLSSHTQVPALIMRYYIRTELEVQTVGSPCLTRTTPLCTDQLRVIPKQYHLNHGTDD
jgi:hypothetical protein